MKSLNKVFFLIVICAALDQFVCAGQQEAQPGVLMKSNPAAVTSPFNKDSNQNPPAPPTSDDDLANYVQPSDLPFDLITACSANLNGDKDDDRVVVSYSSNERLELLVYLGAGEDLAYGEPSFVVRSRIASFAEAHAQELQCLTEKEMEAKVLAGTSGQLSQIRIDPINSQDAFCYSDGGKLFDCYQVDPEQYNVVKIGGWEVQ